MDIVDSSFVNSLKANEQRALATMVNAAGVLSQQAQVSSLETAWGP